MKTLYVTQAIKNIRGRKYILFPKDNAVTSSLYNNELYEPWLYEFLRVNEISVEGTEIIDIGSNNGQIAIEFAHLVGDRGIVHAFEPQRVIYYQLCGNVFFNGLDNVLCHHMALGNYDGTTKVEKPDYHDKGFVNFGDVHVGKEFENYETIQIKKLDSFKFSKVSVIKIDVQGFETEVLNGAINTINEHRPIIFIEIEEDQLYRYGQTEESVIKILKDLNYTVNRFHEGKPFQTISGKCLDFVAVPNDRYNTDKIKLI